MRPASHSVLAYFLPILLHPLSLLLGHPPLLTGDCSTRFFIFLQTCVLRSSGHTLIVSSSMSVSSALRVNCLTFGSGRDPPSLERIQIKIKPKSPLTDLCPQSTPHTLQNCCKLSQGQQLVTVTSPGKPELKDCGS